MTLLGRHGGPKLLTRSGSARVSMETKQEQHVRIASAIEFEIDHAHLTACRRSRITYHRLPEDDPKIRQPDIRLARRILHWEPRVSLDQGLKKTIAYFQKTIKTH